MNFVYEVISPEDVATYELIEVRKKTGARFGEWTVNNEHDIFLLYKKTESRIDEQDFGVSYFVMYYKALWFEVELIREGKRDCLWSLDLLTCHGFNSQGSSETDTAFKKDDVLNALKDSLKVFYIKMYELEQSQEFKFNNFN